MSTLFEAKNIFVKALLACPSFRDHDTRNTLVKELSFASSLKRSDIDFIDVLNIVNGALDYPDGIKELVEIAQEFESGSIFIKSFTNAAQHLKSIKLDKKINGRLEPHSTHLSQNNIVRDDLINQLIAIIEQPLAQVEKPARIYRECLPVNRRSDNQYFPKDLYRSLHHLFDITYDGRGLGFGACVFAKVIGLQPSIWRDINQWLDEAMSKMAWTHFSKDDVRIEANVVRQRIKTDEQVHLQVVITPLDADNRIIAVDLYRWRREDKDDLSRDRIEETTFADLPDQIDEQVDGPALIELFLPTKLMHVNIEFTDEKENCLVNEHKVVRRFVDRQKIPKITKQTRSTAIQRRRYGSWKQRWEMLQQSTSLADLFHPITPRELNSRVSKSNLKGRLKSQPTICCTACDDHPDNHAEQLFHELLDAHIVSGIPIMFWPGKERKLDLEMLKNERLCVDVKSFLTGLREIQLEYLYLEECERGFHHHNLFIIYDNPDLMLPSTSPNEIL